MLTGTHQKLKNADDLSICVHDIIIERVYKFKYLGVVERAYKLTGKENLFPSWYVS